MYLAETSAFNSQQFYKGAFSYAQSRLAIHLSGLAGPARV
jgi:nicotinamide mononucleotide (NMN) deamidase PncC